VNEAAAALDDLGHPVDVDDPLLELRAFRRRALSRPPRESRESRLVLKTPNPPRAASARLGRP
jgi:hypothetical protein